MAKLSVFNRPKIPRKIKILGTEVKVRIHEEIVSGGYECFGLFVPDKMEILLLRDQPNIWQTFLHECCHAAWQISGASEGLGYSREEQLVVALTSALFPLIR